MNFELVGVQPRWGATYFHPVGLWRNKRLNKSEPLNLKYCLLSIGYAAPISNACPCRVRQLRTKL